MKHLQLLLVLAFIFIKANIMGQCTTPPVLSYINISYLEKCGDYYSGSIRANHNIAYRDSTLFTLSMFGVNDTNQIDLLYTETKK